MEQQASATENKTIDNNGSSLKKWFLKMISIYYILSCWNTPWYCLFLLHRINYYLGIN